MAVWWMVGFINLTSKISVHMIVLRMENTVLGNALIGVPEEEEDGEDKPKDSNIETTENIDGEECLQS